METTITNPKRDRKGRFLKKRSAARTSKRRRNESNEPNPRRRGKRRSSVVYKTRYRTRRNEPNPRRGRRRARRNPEGINLGRIVSSGLGGVGVRLVMRKVGGVRPADNKLSGTHYLAAAAAIYVAPNVASWLGASAEEQRAAQDGACGVALAMVTDQHADEFSAAHLMPFLSPAPTGETVGMLGDGIAGGLGATPDRPMTQAAYAGLAQSGQLPARDVYVTAADGSVWRMPAAAGVSGLMGAGMNATTIEIPDSARPGDVIRSRRTGARFRVVEQDGAIAVRPLSGAMGADPYLRAIA